MALVCACGARTPLHEQHDASLEPADASAAADASLPVPDWSPDSPTVDPTPADYGPSNDAHSGLLLDCPTRLDDPRLPLGAPGMPVQIDARTMATSPVSSWRWEALPEACDVILPAPRYRLEGINDPVVVFTAGRPGAHVLRLYVEDSAGVNDECTFAVPVHTPGLYVELCWDTNTTVDLDLYLHRPNTTDPWYVPGAERVQTGFDNNTCNPGNCPAGLRYGLDRVDWGYPDSPLERCAMNPAMHDFADLGLCPNPRSAKDNNHELATGTAEVMQLDYPGDGQTFRVMVQNYENAPARPSVYVFCAGQLTASFRPPSTFPDFAAESPGTFGVMWRPADVTMYVDSAGDTIGCLVTRLQAPDGSAEYVTVNDPSY